MRNRQSAPEERNAGTDWHEPDDGFIASPSPGFFSDTKVLCGQRHTFPLCDGGSEVLHKWRAIEEVVSTSRGGGMCYEHEQMARTASVSDEADE